MNPTTNASFLHRHIASIPSHIATLTSAASQSTSHLATARLTTANALVRLLDQHALALAHLIRALESKHGPVARSLELRGTEASLDAKRGETDAAAALWGVRAGVYTPEVRGALANYAAHLGDGTRRLREAVRAAEGELVEYGVGEEEGDGDGARERRFREIARAHRDARRGIEEAKRDLTRLR